MSPARELLPFLAPLALLGAACSASEPGSSGARVFRAQGCGTCHGQDGAGTSLGPDLRGKAAFWTPGKLGEYLRHPQAYAARDPRLAEQGRRFSLPMPRYDKLPGNELDLLIDHLLGL